MQEVGFWAYLGSGEGRALLAFTTVPFVLRLLGQVLRRLRGGWIRERGAGRSASRQPRDRVWARVVSSGRGLPTGLLCDQIRANGWVPLQTMPSQRWRSRASCVVRRYLLRSDTAPKGAFAVSRWHYRPLVDSEGGDGIGYQAAFELSLDLHSNDNRWHLSRSLRAIPTSAISKRLVVIASVHDMLHHDAIVRCLVVDALATRLKDQPRGHAVLRQPEPLLDGSPTAYTCTRGSVPAAAIWLVVPASTCRRPTSLWGHLEEQYAVSDAVLDEQPCNRGSNGPVEHEMRRLLTQGQRLRFGIWSILSLGAAGLFVLRLATSRNIAARGTGNWDLVAFASDRTTIWLSDLGVFAYMSLAVFALADMFWESVTAWNWQRKERQLTARAPARTLRGQVASVVFARRRRREGPRWNGSTRKGIVLTSMAARGFETERQQEPPRADHGPQVSPSDALSAE